MVVDRYTSGQVKGILVYKTPINKKMGLLWLPKQARQQHVDDVQQYRLGQWLLFDLVRECVVGECDSLYETRLFEAKNCGRDTFVLIKVPVVFFSDEKLEEVVAYSPLIGRVGSFYRHPALIKDRFYSAWVAHMAFYNNKDWQSLIFCLNVDWVIERLDRLLTIEELKQESFGIGELSTGMVVAVHQSDKYNSPNASAEQNNNSDSSNSQPQNGHYHCNGGKKGEGKGENGSGKAVVHIYHPDQEQGICKYQFANVGEFAPGSWASFVACKNWSNCFTAVSPFRVPLPAGITIKQTEPELKVQLSHENYQLDQDPHSVWLHALPLAANVICQREMLQALRRARQSRPLMKPRLLLEFLNEEWRAVDFDGWGRVSPVPATSQSLLLPDEPEDAGPHFGLTTAEQEERPSLLVNLEDIIEQRQKKETEEVKKQKAREEEEQQHKRPTLSRASTRLHSSSSSVSIDHDGHSSSSPASSLPSSSPLADDEPEAEDEYSRMSQRFEATCRVDKGAKGGEGKGQPPQQQMGGQQGQKEQSASSDVHFGVANDNNVGVGGFGRSRFCSAGGVKGGGGASVQQQHSTTATVHPSASPHASRSSNLFSTSTTGATAGNAAKSAFSRSPSVSSDFGIGLASGKGAAGGNSVGGVGGFGAPRRAMASRGGNGGMGLGPANIAATAMRQAQMASQQAASAMVAQRAPPRRSVPPLANRITYYSDLSGLVVSRVTNGFYIYQPDYGAKELFLSQNDAVEGLRQGSWIKFDVSDDQQRQIITKHQLDNSNTIRAKPVRNTVQLTLNAYVPGKRFWKPHIPTPDFRPVVETDYVKQVLDKHALLDADCAGQQFRVVIERGKIPQYPDLTWWIERLLDN